MEKSMTVSLKVMHEMIDEFQCSGCIHGPNSSSCPEFNLRQESPNFGGTGIYFNCKSHWPGTIAAPGGKFCLGLPKGFNKTGYAYISDLQKDISYIRLFAKPEDVVPKDHWNHLNVPVWAMVSDGYLFVRVFSPRVNTTTVDVIKGGTLDMLPPNVIDVSKFVDQID